MPPIGRHEGGVINTVAKDEASVRGMSFCEKGSLSKTTAREGEIPRQKYPKLSFSCFPKPMDYHDQDPGSRKGEMGPGNVVHCI